MHHHPLCRLPAKIERRSVSPRSGNLALRKVRFQNQARPPPFLGMLGILCVRDPSAREIYTRGATPEQPLSTNFGQIDCPKTPPLCPGSGRKQAHSDSESDQNSGRGRLCRTGGARGLRPRERERRLRPSSRRTRLNWEKKIESLARSSEVKSSETKSRGVSRLDRSPRTVLVGTAFL